MAMSFEKTVLVNDWGKEYEEHDLEKVQKTGWKTEDGKEFSSKEGAEEHERKYNRRKYVESCCKSFEDIICSSDFCNRPYGRADRGTGYETVYAMPWTVSSFVMKNKDAILKLLNELEGEK